MIVETGTVIEKSFNTYKIKLKRTEACEGCHSCTFGKNNSYMIMEAVSDIDVNEGDCVRIQRIESSKTIAGFLMFILPLIFFLAGFNLSNVIINSLSAIENDIRDFINILCGILFFSFPLIILKILSKNNGYQMKIIEKL